MNEHYEEDVIETKYQRNLEKYIALVNSQFAENFYPTESDIVDVFYQYNKPDIYELQISIINNFVKVKIVSRLYGDTIINISDLSFFNALIRAVGQFIEWKLAEMQPINTNI